MGANQITSTKLVTNFILGTCRFERFQGKLLPKMQYRNKNCQSLTWEMKFVLKDMTVDLYHKFSLNLLNELQ